MALFSWISAKVFDVFKVELAPPFAWALAIALLVLLSVAGLVAWKLPIASGIGLAALAVVGVCVWYFKKG